MRRQTKLAEDYARSHRLDLDRDLNLRDLGVSAFRGDNLATGALGAFLDAVKQGVVERGSYLLVESLDRVSRATARKAVRVLEDIVEAGVTVVTLNDGKAYTEESLDGFDFLMAVLVLIRAHEESATKARRLKAAWHGKRLKVRDEALTAITPGWIELDSERRPQLIEAHAKVVRRIVTDSLRGVGKHSIAKKLNTEGVPTFGRAKQWHRSYIDKILTAPALVGTFVPHVEEHREGKLRRVPQKPVENYFPAVVDNDTFERLQSLSRTSPLRGRHADTKMRNLLSGLARCPLCGSTMTRVSKGPAAKAGRPFFVCTKAKTGAGCEYRVVPYDAVEGTIVERYGIILSEMPNPDSKVEHELQTAETTVHALENNIAELLEMLERHPSNALAARVAELEGHLRDARKAHDEATSRAALAERKVVALKAKALGVAMRTRPLDRSRANAALRELLDGVVIDYTTGHLGFRWRAGGESSMLFQWPKSQATRARRVPAAEHGESPWLVPPLVWP